MFLFDVVFEQDQCGQVVYFEVVGCFFVFVGIDFYYGGFVSVEVGDFVQYGQQGFVGGVLFCLEINEDDIGVLIDVLCEGLIGGGKKMCRYGSNFGEWMVGSVRCYIDSFQYGFVLICLICIELQFMIVGLFCFVLDCVLLWELFVVCGCDMQ